MTKRKKSRLILTTAVIILGALLLSQFIALANPGATVSVAAAGPSSYNIFLPLVMNNFPPPIIPTVFGVELHDINTGGGLGQMAAANTSFVRRNAVVWSSIETTQGTYNWSAMAGLETELKNASSNGMQVVLIVRSTPEWARKISGTGPSCGPISQSKLPAFGDFMHKLVARYSVVPYNVKYWEMWNEEDGPYITGDNIWGCWGDTSDTYYGGKYYAEMLKAAYPQIKSADPQAQVLVGGLLLDCDPRGNPSVCASLGKDAKPPKFLEGILVGGGGSSFDGVSFHAYDYYQGGLGYYSNTNWQSAWNTTGPVSIAKVQYITSLLTTYNAPGKFLMNTESAILDYCPNDICGGGQTFENTKAYYITQVYATAIATGLRANIWYDVFGWNGSGLLNGNLSPLPAYTAFQFGRSELRAATYSGATSATDIGSASSLIKGYKFQRIDDQHRVWVLWSLDGNTHTITLASAPLAAWDALGASVSTATSMNITVKPLYLEWNP
jgi:Cellulase (glycosyl hydrolase family 5)